MALKVVGSNPTIHPLEGIVFFKKNKIKKRNFKKNINVIKKFKLKIINITKLSCLLLMYKKYFFNKNTTKSTEDNQVKNNKKLQETLILNISQKIYNNKCTILKNKNLYTFSIGSILKYFKIKQGKYVRRSLKGVKIILNFLKNFLKKKFFFQKNKLNNFILTISGFDYNSLFLKKNYKNFFLKNQINSFLLVNLKVSFTKTKDKKIKAIKKRLKKKIILNFIKSNKIKK